MARMSLEDRGRAVGLINWTAYTKDSAYFVFL